MCIAVLLRVLRAEQPAPLRELLNFGSVGPNKLSHSIMSGKQFFAFDIYLGLLHVVYDEHLALQYVADQGVCIL